ncbi:MAG: helix-turn-helix domain-containing protein [Mesorhizobium sp.]|nr:MAG: helix-turn-helix domain-containing protein [Mesorhizobium sp.]
MIPCREEDSGDGISGEDADGLFGCGASAPGEGGEGRQPEQALVVAGWGHERESREDAARIGGMDRQTLRDWVHRFNEDGPDGLKDAWYGGPLPRLSPEQKAELAQIVETGPDLAVDGVVRWRRIDLQRVIEDRFGVAYHERYVGKSC